MATTTLVPGTTYDHPMHGLVRYIKDAVLQYHGTAPIILIQRLNDKAYIYADARKLTTSHVSTSPTLTELALQACVTCPSAPRAYDAPETWNCIHCGLFQDYIGDLNQIPFQGGAK